MTTERGDPISHGDAAILRFLAAAEVIETDLWLQYNELGGIQDDEVPGGGDNEAYTDAIEAIDDDKKLGTETGRSPIYISRKIGETSVSDENR